MDELRALQRACAAAEGYHLTLLRSPEDSEAYERALERSRAECARLGAALRAKLQEAKRGVS